MKRMEPRVLFFTASSDITDEERAAANRIGYNVGFRNAGLVGNKDTPEKTDAIAGEAPNSYRALYPHVKSAQQLTEALRLRDRGQLRLPKFAADGTAANGDGDGSISEAELARLSGELPEDDTGEFNEANFLADKSDQFKAGWAHCNDDLPLPGDASDEFSAGFNAYLARQLDGEGGGGSTDTGAGPVSDKLTKAQLIAEAGKRGVTVDANSTKAEIAAAINAGIGAAPLPPANPAPTNAPVSTAPATPAAAPPATGPSWNT